MPERIPAAKTKDIPPGKSKIILYEKTPILVLNLDGTYFAISNICPHAAGALNEGFIENGRISCPWHGWSFPLSPDDPPNDALPRYRVVVEDDTVMVEVPEVEVDKSWR